MIDHVTLRVKDLARSKAFYDEVMAVLGMKIVLGSQERQFYGWGVDKDPVFEIVQSAKDDPVSRAHVAFKVQDQATVHEFYDKALVAGGKDNGPPGPRLHFSPTYYAAFVIDADGNNIEVCLH